MNARACETLIVGENLIVIVNLNIGYNDPVLGILSELAVEHGSTMNRRDDLREVFKFLRHTVPAILILGGVLVSVIGYSFNFANLVTAGGVSILLGVSMYVLEILVFLIQHYSSDYKKDDFMQLM